MSAERALTATLNFSEIFDVGDHFFHLHAKDLSKDYTPESQIVIDIPSATALFGKENKAATLARVHGLVGQLTADWNERFVAEGRQVRAFCDSLCFARPPPLPPKKRLDN